MAITLRPGIEAAVIEYVTLRVAPAATPARTAATTALSSIADQSAEGAAGSRPDAISFPTRSEMAIALRPGIEVAAAAYVAIRVAPAASPASTAATNASSSVVDQSVRVADGSRPDAISFPTRHPMATALRPGIMAAADAYVAVRVAPAASPASTAATAASSSDVVQLPIGGVRCHQR